MNRGDVRRGGYTIVETLIFLAVSALLFVSAMVLISGRQAKAQFTNSVRDLVSEVTDTANDVANGYYQTGANFACNAGASGPTFPTGEVRGQGTNIGCIFLGRTMKFNGNDPSQLTVYTLAGNRLTASSADVSTVNEAKPKVVTNTSLIMRKNLTNGGKVECIALGQSCTPGNSSNAAISFFTRLTGGISEGAINGSIKTDVYINQEVSLVDSDETAIDKINTSRTAITDQPVTICITAGTNQYGLIHLGSANSTNLTVTSEIKQSSGGLCS